MRWTPLQRLSITSGAALTLLGLGGVVSFYYATRLTNAERVVARTNRNMAAASRIIAGTQDGQRATKAYVVRGDSLARGVLQAAQATVEDAIDAMDEASEDNPRQRRLLESLAPQVAASFTEFRTTIAIRDHFGSDSARRFLERSTPPHETDSLMKIVDQMRDEELRVLAEHARHQSSTGTTTLRIILLGTALTFLLVGLSLQPMRAGVAARLTSHLSPVDSAAAVAEDAPVSGSVGTAGVRLQALHRAVAALAAARSPAEGARALVDAVAAPLAATLAVVVVPNGAGSFTVLHASDSAFDIVSPELAAPVAETLRTGVPLVAASRATRLRQFGTLAGLDALGAPGAVLFVPLRLDANIKGVLLVAFAGDHEFGEDEMAFATTLGFLGGPALASRAFTS
ncbi:MAG: CHASE3 domain-containing protein [Gemmatimonadota bacterium]